MKRIIIIDGYSLFFRAFFATAYTNQFMRTSEGLPTNAIFSFANMMFRVLSEHNFTHILVALDPGGKTFRHDLMETYKGTRSDTPEEMIPQFSLLPELLDALGISYYKHPGVEADDVIGTIARRAEQAGYCVDILSSDRDLLQLIDRNTTVRLLKKGLSEIEDMTLDTLQEQLGILPSQVPELKGLMGDTADNIPGVPGIGEKTGLKLLGTFETIDNLYAHIDQLKGKQKEKLIAHKEQAIMSRTLATIDCQVDIPLEIDNFIYSTIDLQATQHFFRKIESKTLAKKAQTIFDMQSATIAHAAPDLFDGLLQGIEQATELTFMTQADTLFFPEEAILYFEHPFENYHVQKAPLFVVMQTVDHLVIAQWDDFKANVSVREWLASATSKKIVFDCKKAYSITHYAGLPCEGISFDLQLASYVRNPSEKMDELADVAETMGYSLRYREHIYGKNTKFSTDNTEGIAKYALEQAAMCQTLYQDLVAELEDAQLLPLLREVEQPLARVLAEMEFVGVCVNKQTLIEQGKIVSARIKALELIIHEQAGRSFNISSPRQLGEILFEELKLPVIKKTKTGYSTAVDVLEQLSGEHEIIQYISEYRQLTKLYSTYIVGLQPMIGVDGKIHTIYKQTQAQTGRLSSIEPNLQNIPIRLAEGRLIRKAFIPSTEGGVLLSADYSQIELRILAELAHVDELIDAFAHNRDIHTETAIKIFDAASAADVTDLMRSQAKAVNFGIIYGMSDFGLAAQLHVSRKQAKQFIDKYFLMFPEIKAYMARTIADAESKGYVETILKRRRYFPSIHSRNYNERNFAKRAAMNAPIQGSAADILKIAMLRIAKRLAAEQFQSKMILQVHDELIFDVKKEEQERLQQLVTEEMARAYEMKVPLQTSSSIGQTWYEAK